MGHKTLKIISQIVLVLILIWFFSPDIHTWWYQTLDLFNSKCVLVKDCKVVNIDTPNQPNVDFNAEINGKSLVMTFTTNLPVDQIDFARSRVETWKSDFSLVPELSGQYNYTKIYQMYLNSSNFKVSTVDGKTTIIFTDAPATSKYIEREYHMFLYDTSGKVHYKFTYGYNTPTSIVLLTYYSYLGEYIVWYFAIFGTALFRKPYSLVYDSKHKTPLSGAIIRIFKEDVLYRTVVTGNSGVIDVMLDPGKYRIEAYKSGYTFPSALAPLKEDGDYKNLYYGEEYTVSDKSRRLLLNIPIDPKGQYEMNLLKKVGLETQYAIDNFNEYLIVLIMLSEVAFYPISFETYLNLTIGAILILLRQILKRVTKTKLGFVVDEKNNPVGGLRLNLYEAQWNMLEASELTDALGMYQFSVLANKYYIKIQSDKYILLDEKNNLIEKLKISKDINSNFMFINKKIRVRAK